MRVVIEDYVAGERARVATLLVVEFVLATLAASCVLAVVLVALRS
jgi:succinate dehydrogenase hydrophobic anchor subunit